MGLFIPPPAPPPTLLPLEASTGIGTNYLNIVFQDNCVCEDGKCHGCLSDDDCDSDEYCDNGQCKLGCRDDSGKD